MKIWKKYLAVMPLVFLLGFLSIGLFKDVNYLKASDSEYSLSRTNEDMHGKGEYGIQLVIKNPQKEELTLKYEGINPLSSDSLFDCVGGTYPVDNLRATIENETTTKLQIEESDQHLILDFDVSLLPEKTAFRISVWVGNEKVAETSAEELDKPGKDSTAKPVLQFLNAIQPLGIIPTAVNPKDASSWGEFTNWLSDPSVDQINLTQSFSATSNPPSINRPLVINGAGNTLNMGSRSFVIDNSSTAKTLAVANLTLQNSSNTSIFTSGSQNGSNWNIIFQNINSPDNNTGGLITATNASVEFMGEGKWRTAGSANTVDATNLTFDAGSKFVVNSQSSSARMTFAINNAGHVYLGDDAEVTVKNEGTSSSKSSGSHAFGVNFSSVILDDNSKLTITTNGGHGFYTSVNSSFHVENGAVLDIYAENRAAILLDNKADFMVTGENSRININGNYNGSGDEGAMIAISSGNLASTINVLDHAEINIDSKRCVAMLMQSQGGVFNVDNHAKLNLTSHGQGSVNGATLRFRDRPNQTFNISNYGEINIHKTAEPAPGIRFGRENGTVNVNSGGKFTVTNQGNGTPSNGSSSTGENSAVFYDETANTFKLDGKDSVVQLRGVNGPAIYSSGTVDITAGQGTVFTAEGHTNEGASSSNQNAGIFRATTATVKMNNPLFYDFKNNRKGNGSYPGGSIFNVNASSTFESKNSDLSVWQKGRDVNGNPTHDWTLVNYSLNATNFSNLVSSDDPTLTAAFSSSGMNAYSRMSANNANATIEWLRIPTNADKTIYGHATVPVALSDIRDAWQDEVHVQIEVKKTDGSIENYVADSIGMDDIHPGESMFGEVARGGIFKVSLSEFLEEGDEIRVTGAWRGPKDAPENKRHTSNVDDIKSTTNTTIDVTPPEQAVISMNPITNATKQLTGTATENGAKVFVKVNGSWLMEGTAPVMTTVSGGTWIIDLPGYISKADMVEVYLKDNTTINPVFLDPDTREFILPETYINEPDGVYGNANIVPATYNTPNGGAYHDAQDGTGSGGEDLRFDPATLDETKDVLPDMPQVTKKLIADDLNDIKVSEFVSYKITVKNNKPTPAAGDPDPTWKDVKLVDPLPIGVTFDASNAELKVGGVALDPADYEVTYDALTKISTLTIKNLGNLSAQESKEITFKVKVNRDAVNTKIPNTAAAVGFTPQEKDFVKGPDDPDHEKKTTEASGSDEAPVDILVYFLDIPVEFVDRNNTVLDSATIDDVYVGQSFNASTNTAVATKLSTILSGGYILHEVTIDGAVIDPTNVTATDPVKKITYVFSGTLSIFQAPDEIDFGIENLDGKDIKVDAQTWSANDGTPKDFIIWDNRHNRSTSKWYLTAKLTQELTRQSGAYGFIPNAIHYIDEDGEDVTLSSTTAEVIVNRNQSSDKYNISDDWRNSATEEGFKVMIPAGGVKGLGEYQAKIQWVLSDTK